MMRAIFLLAITAACSPGHLMEKSGQFAVQFDQVPDCIEIDTSYIDLIAPYTVEAYIFTDDVSEYVKYPVAVWPGAFALYVNQNGYTVFGPTDDVDTGLSAASTNSMMTGEYHHVAATFDTDQVASLYLDGQKIGTANNAELLRSPGDTLYLGCWPGQYDATFSGQLGEVMLTNTVAYTENFTPTWLEYGAVAEGDTAAEAEADLSGILGLWHMNEGQGEGILDSTGSADGILTEGSWVSFVMEGTAPVSAGDTTE